MTIEIKVPDLPESVADATIATWHKKPGDLVARDEVLVDIETDKVVLEVPAPEAGVLGDILQLEGATVLSRQLIAILKAAPVAGEETKEKPVDVATDDAADGLSPSVRRLVAEARYRRGQADRHRQGWSCHQGRRGRLHREPGASRQPPPPWQPHRLRPSLRWLVAPRSVCP